MQKAKIERCVFARFERELPRHDEVDHPPVLVQLRCGKIPPGLQEPGRKGIPPQCPPLPPLPAAPAMARQDLDAEDRLRSEQRPARTATEAEPIMPGRQQQPGPSGSQHATGRFPAANLQAFASRRADDAALKAPEEPPAARLQDRRLLFLQRGERDRGQREIGIAEMKKAKLESRLIPRRGPQLRRNGEIERASARLQLRRGEVAPSLLKPAERDDIDAED